MTNKLQTAIKSILAGAALTAISTGAFASGAVSTTSFGTLGNNSSITSSTYSISSATSWTGNASLGGDSWAHTGKWFTFDYTGANQTVIVDIAELTGSKNFAFTVWASGSTVFNGGTGPSGETPTIGFGAPHSFNQVGQLGDNGTLWAADSSVVTGGLGNLKETLAYNNNGVATTLSGYGEAIHTGVNQVATDNAFFAGSVSGQSTSSNESLVFNDLSAGYYTIFVGGANAATTSASTYDITVTSVPEPSELLMFGFGLTGLAAVVRKKQKQA